VCSWKWGGIGGVARLLMMAVDTGLWDLCLRSDGLKEDFEKMKTSRESFEVWRVERWNSPSVDVHKAVSKR